MEWWPPFSAISVLDQFALFDLRVWWNSQVRTSCDPPAGRLTPISVGYERRSCVFFPNQQVSDRVRPMVSCLAFAWNTPVTPVFDGVPSPVPLFPGVGTSDSP